jgi:hypothetical protein
MMRFVKTKKLMQFFYCRNEKISMITANQSQLLSSFLLLLRSRRGTAEGDRSIQ